MAGKTNSTPNRTGFAPKTRNGFPDIRAAGDGGGQLQGIACGRF
jgi:hypothetical protein